MALLTEKAVSCRVKMLKVAVVGHEIFSVHASLGFLVKISLSVRIQLSINIVYMFIHLEILSRKEQYDKTR